MKVLYDISVLGLAQREKWQRAGVHRVVDEIARQLVEKCELSFSCTVVPSVAREALDYVRSDAALKAANFVETRESNGTPDSFLGQLKLRGRQRIRNLFGQPSPIDPTELAKVDIFHAPAFYLPGGLEKARRVRQFLTIYDLIPVLLPHLCREGSKEFVEQALASLTPDRWAICISDATKNDLCEYLPSLSPERVFVTPLAASSSFYPCSDSERQEEVRKKYNIPPGQYLLSLGTLEPRKNLNHLIRCFASLTEEADFRDVNLILVGAKGWDYDTTLETLTKCNSGRKRIFLTGYVEDADLAPLYSGAVAFVYPSLYEGFGLPPLEAMQCGTPVIVSNTSSLPEVVDDAGIMVAPNDSDALAQAIIDLTTDCDRRAELSKRATRRAGEFSWGKCAEQTIAAYQTALAS